MILTSPFQKKEEKGKERLIRRSDVYSLRLLIVFLFAYEIQKDCRENEIYQGRKRNSN